MTAARIRNTFPLEGGGSRDCYPTEKSLIAERGRPQACGAIQHRAKGVTRTQQPLLLNEAGGPRPRCDLERRTGLVKQVASHQNDKNCHET